MIVKTVRTLLSEAVIGLAGKATAIGDAIGLGVKRLRERDESQRVLILLTDGANTAGVVDPLSAAELASREGLKIYAIGIGATELVERSLFGTRKINPSADLDETVLKEIASLTGGAYFRARDLDELERIYALIDELEPVEQDPKKFRPKKSLYYWPLAAALVARYPVGSDVQRGVRSRKGDQGTDPWSAGDRPQVCPPNIND